jgi:hypothetical protein
MRQKTERHQDAAERTIKDIRRQTRKRYSSAEWTVVMPLEICLPSLSADINELTGLPGHVRLRVK